MPDEKGISISKKIVSPKERARLKSVVSLLKPAGVGVIIRTEAEGQSESEIQEDLEFLLDKWNTIVVASDTVEPPSLVSRDQDLLYRVIREACTEDVSEIIVDTSFALHRANQLLQSWNMNQNLTVTVHKGMDPLLVAKGIDREIRSALQTKVNMPSGGYLFIQQTEALTVIDVNSGKFTSSATQGETIRKTNFESVSEVARQLRIRNIGGMIIVDFIDMDNRIDKLAILEAFELALEPDKSRPQIGQLSDLGLVELTRHRQGQSLSEIFTRKCPACSGSGLIIEGLNFASSPNESEYAAKSSKMKLPHLKNQRKPMPQASGDKPNGFKQDNRHRIPTSPSVVASARTSTELPKKEFELNMEEIKELSLSKGVPVQVSSAVRLASAPIGIVNKHLGDEFKKDVFVELSELENTEESAEKTSAQEPVQHYQQPVRHGNTQQRQVRRPDFRQQPQGQQLQQRPINRPHQQQHLARPENAPMQQPSGENQQQAPIENQQQEVLKPVQQNVNRPVMKEEAVVMTPKQVVITEPLKPQEPMISIQKPTESVEVPNEAPVAEQQAVEKVEDKKPEAPKKRAGRPKSATPVRKKVKSNDEEVSQ
jgi:ribonuclease E